jgi:mannose/fructose/N-acetylgalactosamine-specific phosphotransferase system component IIB
MAQLAVVRIDAHLIHSQVRHVWLKLHPCKLIIVIDDAIAHDSLLAKVYSLAAPPGLKVATLGVEEAAAAWKKDQFGPLGPVFAIMKDVKTAYDVYLKGFVFPEVLVGNLDGTAGGGAMNGPIKVSDADEKMLAELRSRGCKVTFPNTPAEYVY